MTRGDGPSAPRRRLLEAGAACAASVPLGAGAAPRGPANAPAEPAPIAGRGYRLVHDWDFGATVTDERALREAFHTRYLYEDGRLDHLNDEWQRYRDDRNHEFVDGGLALVARVRDGLRPAGIESGMLRSKWSGRHGYFECRMKPPRVRGAWPAFWLNPQDGRWPPEIDVVEIVDNGRDTTRHSFHFVHGRGVKTGRVVSSRLDRHGRYAPGFDYADDHHTFGVEWTADTVRHFVDDTLVIERRFAWEHDDGSDGGPAHLLVNLAVGGRWPGPPRSADDFPARLHLRFVRVWQR